MLIKTLLLFSLMASFGCNKDEEDNCPVSPATGTITCWESEKIVYQSPIYYNGGYLCTYDGHEIRLEGQLPCKILTD